MEAGPSTSPDNRPSAPSAKEGGQELEQLRTPSTFTYQAASHFVSALESDSNPVLKWTKAGIFLGLGALASFTTGKSVNEKILNASRVDESLSSLHLMARERAPKSLVRAGILMGANIEAEATPLLGPLAGRTSVRPLHLAAVHQNTAASEALLEGHANPNSRDSAGETPIRAAYGDGTIMVSHDLVRLYKKHGADLNAAGLDGSNTLSACICADHTTETRFLISEGANLATISAEEWNRVANTLAGRVYFSVQQQHWDYAEAHLKELLHLQTVLGYETIAQIVNSKPAENSFSGLHAVAAFGGPTAVAELLLRLGANVGDTADVEIKSSKGAQVRSLSRPLHLAVLAEDYELTKLLLDWGADPKAKDSRGENPLFMLYRNDRTAAKRIFVETLVSNGVEVNEANHEGVNCPTLCVQSSKWNEATLLGEFGGKPFGLTEADLSRVESSLRFRLASHIKQKQWTEFHSLLEYSNWQFEEGSPGLIKRLVNSRANNSADSPSLFHKLCSTQTPNEIFERVLDLGADVRAPTRFEIPPETKLHHRPIDIFQDLLSVFGEFDREEQRKAQKVSPLHILVASGNFDGVISIIARGAPVNARDSLGNSPFMYGFLTSPGENRVAILKHLLANKADPYQQNFANEDAYLIAFERGLSGVITALAEDLAKPPLVRSPLSRWYRPQDPADSEHFKEVLGEVIEAAKMVPAARDAMREMLVTSQNLDHALQFAKAFEAATRMPFIDQGEQLARLMPHLLSTYRPEVVSNLAHSIEYGHLSHGIRGYHPNEVELLAMLNHPRDPTRSARMINVLTSSITSIGQLYQVGAQVDGVTVANWGRIGTASLSFSRLKYDAARVFEVTADGERRTLLPALIEQYGMQPMPNLESDGVFGKGFFIAPGDKKFPYWVTTSSGARVKREFDQQTAVIFRRANYIVSHPDHGTLVIRNSSPEFGRDTLPHPAYWSIGGIGKAFSLEDLFDAGSNIRQHFEPLLEATYNNRNFSQLQKHLKFLVEQVRAVFEDYGAWKFDTRAESAWDHMEDVGTLLQGGHLSRGFKSVVRYLEETLEQSMRHPGKAEVPDLAFMHPDFSPWNRFAFEQGNQRVTTLKVTPEVVDVLRQMADGDYQDTALRSTAIRKFFQQAGFNTQGELIFVKPS